MSGAAPGGLVLGIDLGTTALKAGLVTLTGTVLRQECHDLPMTLLPDGGVVQDAEHWWELLGQVAPRLLAQLPAGHGSVRAVAVTGQWASTVPVGSDGVPVGPCVMWLDSRGAAQARRRVGGPVAGYDPRHLAAWVRLTGGAPALDGADPLGHRWYLQDAQPDLYAKARWLMEPVDYLSFRLTGRAAATQASMVGAWLTDNRKLDPGTYDAGLVRRAGLDPNKLPPLLPNGSLHGSVRPDVAARLGLPADVPVVAGAGDAHVVGLGSGAVELYEAHLSLGTTSWISCYVQAKKTDVINQIAAVPSCVPGRYMLLNNHETSGRCLQWLREVVSDPDQPVSFRELDALAEKSAPGAGSVIFTPWLAGERTPIADRNARAGFHNVSLATTRADLVRSVLEGVAYNDRWTLDLVERFVGRRLDRIRMVGGGARSALWCQIHADVLNRTIEQVEDPENAGLRGAALGAAMAMGELTVQDVRDVVPVAATFVPNQDAVARYAELYREFPGLYRRQKKMFARLNGPRPA